MPDESQPKDPGLGQALGRVPSGLYILTVRQGGRATGMLASWVQQAGFDPPMVTVAVQRDRFVGDWIDGAGRFALSQIAVGGKPLIRHFSRGFTPDAPAFEGLELRADALGGPILAGAMAYLDAEVVGRRRASEADHRIYLARIVAGGILDPNAEPLKHVRASGYHY